MIRNRIGEMRLKRKNGGITKAYLAQRVGISRSYVTKLEQGRVTPSPELMFRIANYFECPVEKVFSYEARQSPRPEVAVRPVRGGERK
jgi:putative transcriptional regulator